MGRENMVIGEGRSGCCETVMSETGRSGGAIRKQGGLLDYGLLCIIRLTVTGVENLTEKPTKVLLGT